MTQKLYELFSAPTGKLQQVDAISGISLYTSDALKQKYLIAMSKSGRTKPVFNTIKDLVDREILVPVYSTNKLLKSIFKKQPIQIRDFAGFVSSDKKIYILVETGSNVFSFTSNDAIAMVTLHELVHYFAQYHLSEFYNIFKDDLNSFYRYFYRNVLSCDDSKLEDKYVSDLVKFINFELEATGIPISNQRLLMYFDKINKTFKDASTLDDGTFNDKAMHFMIVINTLQKLILNNAAQNVLGLITSNKQVFTQLYSSYKNTQGINPMDNKSLCFQELWSTSEVISITTINKTPSQKIYNAIKRI